MKHQVKAPPKKPKKKKAATPDDIAAEVRSQLAPAIAPLGVVGNTVQFLNRMERMAATLAVWGPKINLTANPRDAAEIVFHVFDSIIPISISASARIIRLDRVHRILDIGSGAGFPGLVIASALNGSVTLALANTGTGAASALSLTSLTASVLTGTGSVSVSAPSLPYPAGALAPGATANVTVQLTVTGTVSRVKLLFGGGMQNSAGAGLTFSGAAQVLLP